MFHDWMWGGMWFGWIFWVFIIILIFWAIVGSNRRRGNWNMMPPQETPLDILKKRYARGEISKEQFDQMRKDIEL